MLADGHQDLSSHVSALLCSRRLVLDMDAGSALLDEEFGQLHDSRQAAVASVSIGNDGAEVVDVVELGALGLGHAEALLALLAVVEELGHEEVTDFVWYGGLGCGVSKEIQLRGGGSLPLPTVSIIEGLSALT